MWGRFIMLFPCLSDILIRRFSNLSDWHLQTLNMYETQSVKLIKTQPPSLHQATQVFTLFVFQKCAVGNMGITFIFLVYKIIELFFSIISERFFSRSVRGCGRVGKFYSSTHIVAYFYIFGNHHLITQYIINALLTKIS